MTGRYEGLTVRELIAKLEALPPETRVYWPKRGGTYTRRDDPFAVRAVNVVYAKERDDRRFFNETRDERYGFTDPIVMLDD